MIRPFVVVLLLFVVKVNAQNNIEEIQNKINRTVWKPFQKAFETSDGKALNVLYADEVLRVTPNGIDTENTFKASNLERFKSNRSEGISISLDFWFDSRHTNETTSYEVGFYRIGATDGKGGTSYNYGQFHIVLKNIDGEWKITQDWDTATLMGIPITASDFSKGMPQRF